MTFRLDVYAADDLNGAVVGAIDLTQDAIDARFTDVLHGAGSMELTLPRHHPDAALLQRDRGGRLVTDAGTVGLWFLEEGVVDLSSESEEGGELIKWEGRGALAILDRGVMDNDSNISGGMDPIEGFWDLSAQGNFAGADSGHPIPMMKRALVEVALNLPNAIALVDHSGFTYALDSNADPAPFLDGVFGVDVGNSLYQLAGRLDQLGGFIQRMSGTFVYSMFLTYGDDLTGAFDPATVRFEKGVNVSVALQRKITPNVTRTHLVVSGANHSYLSVANPTYNPGDVVRWGFLAVPETDDLGQLETVALNNFAARERASDAYILPMPAHGDDPANGLYEPGLHFKCGDSVTGHTGTDPDDLNESSQVVAAITWRTKDGTDYVYDVELGYNYHWTDGPGDEFGPGTGGQTTWLPHKRYDDFARASLQFPASGGDPISVTSTPSNAGMGLARSGRPWKVFDENSDSFVQMDGYRCYLTLGPSGHQHLVAYVNDPKGVWVSDDTSAGTGPPYPYHAMHVLMHGRFGVSDVDAGGGTRQLNFCIGDPAIAGGSGQVSIGFYLDSVDGLIVTGGGSTPFTDWEADASYDFLWEYNPFIYSRVKVWRSVEEPPEAWSHVEIPDSFGGPYYEKSMSLHYEGEANDTILWEFIDIIHGEFAHGLATDDAGSAFGAHVADPTDAHPASAISGLQTIGHYELLVTGSAPPVAVTNEAEDDFVYGWVSG